MHNMFITQGFDWSPGGSGKVQKANKLLERLGFAARVIAPGSSGYMTSVEQRMNVYHLVSQVLAYGVEGDLIEVGSFTGQTATLIGKVLANESPGSTKKVHVYDSFAGGWGDPDPRATLELNFRRTGVTLPEIHAGRFDATMPAQLPAKIAFAHIDVGTGAVGEKAIEQRDVLCFVFEHVYPRLAKGAVCSLVDYWDPTVHSTEIHENFGVTLACEKFLADKPERVSVLYSGYVTQGYFRKA
jgi:O-methyltransferase